jgi:hypothetical protein
MLGASIGTLVRVAVALLVVSCASPSGRSPGTEGEAEPTVVRFSYDGVKPATVRISADGNLTWVNEASDTRAYVVFPAGTASSFTCDSLVAYFTRTPAGYQSLPITSMESETVKLPCPLAPGSYDYEIWLVGVGLDETSDDATPQQVLRAKIVVE